ncbi:MAG: PQQ-binding-like beta-propeller repeat protein [Ignavibacteria bacterium]
MIVKVLGKGTILILIVLSVCMFFPSCSGITVDKEIKVSQDDWVMSGGSPEQQHVSKYTLAPPLNLMWDYNIEGGVGPNGITASDAVVFVNALQGELFTFDVKTGGKIGNLKFLGKDCSTAPLIIGNDVILTYAGDKNFSLASYDISQGKINWRKNYGDIQTSPILKDGYIYFSGLNGYFYKVDKNTGAKIWKLNTKGQVHSTCAIGDGIAVLGNDKGFIIGVDINTGAEKWKVETGQPVISTLMIYGEHVYIGANDSNYYKIGLMDGAISWKVNLHTKIIGGAAIDINGNIITGCVDGSIYSLSNALGEVNWKTQTNGTIISSPIISGNFIYVSSYDSYIYSLDVTTGKILWSNLLENKVKTTPVIWKDYLFVAADEIVYCFTNKPIEKVN